MKSIRDNVINMNKEADDSNSLMVKIMNVEYLSINQFRLRKVVKIVFLK